MGATVQEQKAVPPGHIETRTLIDGQQRLTTLQLLLKAFHDSVKTLGNEPYSQALRQLIRNDHPLIDQPHEKFKVWPTNADRDDFRAVMTCDGRAALLTELGLAPDTERTERQIPDAYLYFTREIGKWLAADAAQTEVRTKSLYGAIWDNVRLVVIDLDDKDDAQVIFETLNARGTPLLSADLVKNSLMNEVLAAEGNAEEAYEQYWKKFDADAKFWRMLTGRGHARRARIETFLQHTLTLLTGKLVSSAHLYSAYRDYAVSPQAGTPIERLKKFNAYGNIYKTLQDTQSDKRINTFFERLRTLDVVTAWPFILALYQRCQNQTDTIRPVLAAIESFLIRRMVCRLSTRGYNDVFANLTPRLDGDPAQAPQAVAQALLASTAEVDRWPDDGEFFAAWTENPLYENLSQPRLRMLLEALEAGRRNHFAETLEVPKNLTIEHVMPQHWEEHWPLTGTTKERRNKVVHAIGNLTLLNEKLNPSQSNKPWIDGKDPDGGKRAALKKYTVLFLNKDLCDFPDWNEARIYARSETLFKIALKIWPHGGDAS
jgi:hypothetical protein